MTDFARVQSNVQKMVDLKAPPDDIDGYLKTEGLSPEQFKAQATQVRPQTPDDDPGFSPPKDNSLSGKYGPQGGEGPTLEQMRNPIVTPNDPTLYRATPRPAGEALNDLVREGANAATFGLANKAAAAMSPGDYQQNLDKLEGADQQIRDRYPLTNAVGRVGGTIANPAWKVFGGIAGKALPIDGSGVGGFLKRIGNYAMQGGMAGATDEAINRDAKKQREAEAALGATAAIGMVSPEGGTIPEFAEDVGKAALKSGAASAAIPGGLEVGGGILHAVLSPILKRLAPDSEGIARIYKAMEEGGLTTEMLESKLSKRGDQGMVADASPSLTKLAEDTAQFSGEARTIAQRELGSRSGSRILTTGGPQGRIEQAIDDNLSSETAKATAQSLLEDRSTAGTENFSKLFAKPIVPESDDLSVLAKNPVVKRAMASGKATALNFANADGKELPDEAFFIDGKPTLQAWHEAKSDIDSTIYGLNSGKLLPQPDSASPASLKAISDKIRNHLSENYPEYESAVNDWAGHSAALDALNLGVKAAKGDARIAASQLNDMTDSEREFFRIGLADQTRYLVSKTPDGSNAVKSIFGNQNARRNLEAAFDTREDFNKFRRAIAMEQNFFSTKSQVLGGSQTASREAGMKEQLKEIGEAALEGAKEGGVEGATIQGTKAAGKRAMAFVTAPEDMRATMAKNLFSRDPAVKAQTIAALKALESRGSIFGSPGLGYIPGSGALMSRQPFSFGGQ